MTELVLSAREKPVLMFLLERYSEDMGVYPFEPIVNETKLPRSEVRLACRSLARKGFTEFVRGCWTEEGGMAGSGYRATKQASAALSKAGVK